MSREYFNTQFLAYAPITLESCGQIRIKLTSEKGATNWLNLTPEQARAIEAIILIRTQAICQEATAPDLMDAVTEQITTQREG